VIAIRSFIRRGILGENERGRRRQATRRPLRTPRDGHYAHDGTSHRRGDSEKGYYRDTHPNELLGAAYKAVNFGAAFIAVGVPGGFLVGLVVALAFCALMWLLKKRQLDEALGQRTVTFSPSGAVMSDRDTRVELPWPRVRSIGGGGADACRQDPHDLAAVGDRFGGLPPRPAGLTTRRASKRARSA